MPHWYDFWEHLCSLTAAALAQPESGFLEVTAQGGAAGRGPPGAWQPSGLGGLVTPSLLRPAEL